MEDNRKDFDILNKMKRLPGGLVIIPLVLAVIIATSVSYTHLTLPTNSLV